MLNGTSITPEKTPLLRFFAHYTAGGGLNSRSAPYSDRYDI